MSAEVLLCASVVLYVAVVVSLFVPRLHWCLWKAVLRDCSISRVSSFILFQVDSEDSDKMARNKYWRTCFVPAKLRTVDSRYLEVQGTPWNTSRCPYLDISDLRNWGKQWIEQPKGEFQICPHIDFLQTWLFHFFLEQRSVGLRRAPWCTPVINVYLCQNLPV